MAAVPGRPLGALLFVRLGLGIERSGRLDHRPLRLLVLRRLPGLGLEGVWRVGALLGGMGPGGKLRRLGGARAGWGADELRRAASSLHMWPPHPAPPAR